MGSPSNFEPLRVLDKYEIIRRIAQGGMGEIFLARQTGVAGFNRLVIIKSLLPDLASDEGILASFLNEARIGATLNHPNIVAIYEIDQWEGVYFLAMEYVSGGGLDNLQRAAYKKQVPIPRLVSAQIVRDAAAGLDHAHHARDHEGEPLNIVHRDVTPQNIMVRLDGVVKVLDFGIAKAAGSDNRTQAGEVKGKLAYLAPEQIKGEDLDGRCDQFALGITFWELCTGRRLFNAPNPIDIFKKILAHEIPRPSQLDPSVPAELEAVVMRMLSDKREDRYPRLMDVARDINSWVEKEGGTSDQVALFIKEMIGSETQEITRDLTPTPVKIQGLTPTPRVGCPSCGARNTAKARFCTECGAPLERTNEASRKMIAAAVGAPPFEDSGPQPAVPASVDELISGTWPVSPGLTSNPGANPLASYPPSAPIVDPGDLQLELERAAADARVTMEDIFGAAGTTPPANARPGRLPPLSLDESGPVRLAPAAFQAPQNPFLPGGGAAPFSPPSSVPTPSNPFLPNLDESAPVPTSRPPPLGSDSLSLDTSGRSPASPAARPDVYLGRQDVLTAVGRLLREVTTGSIRTLVVCGDTGMGKTATLGRAAALASAAQLRVVQAQGRRFGPRRPLDVYVQLLAALSGKPERDPAGMLDWVRSLRLPEASFQRVRCALTGEGSLASLVEEQVQLTVEQDLVSVFLEAARSQGLCLVIDDFHWADAASRRLLSRLARRVDSARVAILCSASKRFDHADFPQLELGPLLDAEILQLVDGRMGEGGLPSSVQAALLARAQGNPGFALDLLEVLRWEGAIHNLGGQWTTTATFETLQLPPNPVYLVTSRIRALDKGVQSFLKTAAAQGQVFEVDRLSAALRKGTDVRAALGTCVGAQFIEQVDHGIYRFTRGAFAEVALLLCEGAELRQIHQRLYKGVADDMSLPGAALEAAGHLVQGDAAQLLGDMGIQVARELRDRGLVHEASSFYEAVVQGHLEGNRHLLGEDEGAVRKGLELATEAVRCLRREMASEAIHLAGRVLKAMADLPGTRGERAALLRERALGFVARLKHENAEQDLDAALELVADLPGSALRAALLADLGVLLGRRGDWQGAVMQLETAIRSMTPEDPDVPRRLGELALAYRHTQQLHKAQAAAAEARRRADASGSLPARVLSMLQEAEVVAAAGDPARARAEVEAVQRMAQSQGDGPARVLCHLTLVEVERAAHHERRAEDQRKRAMNTANEVGWKQALLEAGAGA